MWAEHAGSKAWGTCAVPCSGMCGSRSKGLAGHSSRLCLSSRPAASTRAARWARPGSSLPIPKVGWQTMGHRLWPEATGVLAKRVGIVPLALKEHSRWDDCRPAQLNQAGSKVSQETGSGSQRQERGSFCGSENHQKQHSSLTVQNWLPNLHKENTATELQ